MRRITSCTSLSDQVGMPSGRCFPFALGMYVRRAGVHRYRSKLSSAKLKSPHGATESPRAVTPYDEQHPPAMGSWRCKPNQLGAEGCRVKCARDQMDIVNAYAALGTYRGAAAVCGTTHKTVKRVLERRASGQVGRRRSRPANTACVQALIEERVRQTDGRISAKRLLPVARAA